MAKGNHVRIDADTHATLSRLARAKSLSLSETVARAVEAYRRTEMLAQLHAGYAALREDPEAWADEQAERAGWDATLDDAREDA